MRARNETFLFQYGVAFLATATAIAVRWVLDPWIAPAHPFSMVYGAVAIAVWCGGWGPALVATALGYAVSFYLFIGPEHTFFSTKELVNLPIYLAACAIIIGFGLMARSAQRRVGGILESITECFFALDREWRYTYVNGAAERYFRRSRQSMLGRVMWDEFPQLAGTALDSSYRKAMAENVPVHLEVRSPVSKRWLDVHAYPSEEGLTVVFSDVTKRRQAQEMAERNAGFLRLVADSVGVLIAYLDTERRFRFINRRYEEVFGITEPRATGLTAAEVMGDAQYECVRPQLDRAFEGESTSGEMVVRSIEPAANQLVERHMIATYSPDRDANGTVRGVVVALSDISDRIEAEHALREADRRKDEFLAMLAHELRNPLAPILNATQLLGLERVTGPQEAKLRDIIDRQVRHMARLVDDLLDVSRITLGRINLHTEDVSLETVIANAVEASRPLIDASRHELSVELPRERIFLTADLTRLSQVFLNLLNNAAKYTPPGGRIRICATYENDEVCVSVKDTGVGISQQMLPRIFDLFTQVDGSLERTQGGLGLGLTLASRLVGMHGGQLVARSEGLGRGSEFIVRLPATREVPASMQPRTSRALADPNGQLKRRVLVVDDNVDAAASLNMLLQASGHETRMAHDGVEAVKMADEFSPDVVLLDIGLPRLNGYDAARRIREGQGERRPVVVALTGWGQDEDKQRAVDAGFDLHLTKPVDPVVVMELVSDSPAAARRRSPIPSTAHHS